ncbi:MAG TPA: sodium:proline symporter, partial [Ruminococcaceae bacterium]|nr:sodium:proline symporter [Oscillospiraceae bacterium]
LATKSGAENVFAHLSQLLFHPVIAGVIMAGILAATISSSDSYLLIAASAASKNLFEGIIKKDADDKQVMNVSRIMLVVITVIGMIIAWNENSVIFEIVSFAWSGFGATFGPIILFSLFWKRTNRVGAVAGMVSGGAMVFIWKLLLKPLGGIFGIYELMPAFLISCAFIVIVSLCTEKPSAELEEEFEKAKNYTEA